MAQCDLTKTRNQGCDLKGTDDVKPHAGHQGIVGQMDFTQTCQNFFKAGGNVDGHLAQVNAVDGSGNVHQLFISFQPEAAQQNLKTGARTNVCKKCAIVVIANHVLGGRAVVVQPDNLEIFVNEVRNQPGRSQSVHPRPGARCPSLVLNFVNAQARNGLVDGLRFAF